MKYNKRKFEVALITAILVATPMFGVGLAVADGASVCSDMGDIVDLIEDSNDDRLEGNMSQEEFMDSPIVMDIGNNRSALAMSEENTVDFVCYAYNIGAFE